MRFLGFKEAFNVFKRYWYRNTSFSISCFFIDIELISKIFKIVLDGSPGFVGARLFEKCKILDFRKSEIYKNNINENVPAIALICFLYPGVSKDKNNLVLGLGNGFKNPEIIEMMVFGFSFPHKQIEKLLIQIEAE